VIIRQGWSEGATDPRSEPRRMRAPCSRAPRIEMVAESALIEMLAKVARVPRE
jgi:hypothetical protein